MPPIDRPWNSSDASTRVISDMRSALIVGETCCAAVGGVEPKASDATARQVAAIRFFTMAFSRIFAATTY
jgi:hypothetical protein